MRIALCSLLICVWPLAATASPESYCAGPGCEAASANAETISTDAELGNMPPHHIIYSLYLVLMMTDLAQKYPDQTVSSSFSSSGAPMTLELHDVVNLILFLDPFTLNQGLEPRDFVPTGTMLPESGAQTGNDPGVSQSEFSFDFMTPGDYKGHLDMMLDDLIVQYPDRTIPADALAMSETISIPMSTVANLLIFLDPHLENLGWSTSVFEPDV